MFPNIAGVLTSNAFSSTEILSPDVDVLRLLKQCLVMVFKDGKYHQ